MRDGDSQFAWGGHEKAAKTRSSLKTDVFREFSKIRSNFEHFFDTFQKMATGKLELIGYIFIWATSYLTISIQIAYFPLGLPENVLKKSFRKPPSYESLQLLLRA